MRIRLALLALPLVALGAVPASAEVVSLTGLVANLCVLAVTPGTLGMTTEGTVMSTEGTGGIPAILAVTATGADPTISFGAPTLTGPSASTGSATKEIAFTSPAGANQAFTTGTSSYVMHRLLDTVTIRGRVTNPQGFATGSYGISTTVTCQQ